MVDYAIDSLIVQPKDDATFESRFVAKRLGDGYFPQQILVTFENGITETVSWDGLGNEKEFVFDRPAALSEVHLDPEDAVWLDINRLNNRKRLEPDNRFAWLQFFNVTVWVQQWLNVAGGFF